jgi:drug/metabolite transporter (DMT)-like permease
MAETGAKAGAGSDTHSANQAQSSLLSGTGFALAAGLMWGLVFIAPTLLADYPPALLSMGRYLAFGLIALPLAWMDWPALRLLKRADWIEALKLSLIGNLLYYGFLAAAIQRAGGPLPTMIIGTLPVVIAVVANWRANGHTGQMGPNRQPTRKAEARLPWRQLLPALVLLLLGLACVNQAELAQLKEGTDLWRYASGAALALVAVACWTWYPIRNGEWLRLHSDRSPRAWATAQGLVTLPLALLGYGLVWLFSSQLTPAGFAMPLGPQPLKFLALMLVIALFASWLGTLCWNEASQRLPPALAGQLIVFETLAALAYAFVLRGHWPGWLTGVGVLLLVAGVVVALRVRPVARKPVTHSV